jgi:hypothetical protein
MLKVKTVPPLLQTFGAALGSMTKWFKWGYIAAQFLNHVNVFDQYLYDSIHFLFDNNRILFHKDLRINIGFKGFVSCKYICEGVQKWTIDCMVKFTSNNYGTNNNIEQISVSHISYHQYLFNNKEKLINPYHSKKNKID